jgi:hypothetical protein
VVLLDDGRVPDSALDEVGAVTVQSATGQHGALQGNPVQQGLEGGYFVALGGDLPLGQDCAMVVHRGQQLDRGRGLGARALHGLAVDGDGPQGRPLRGRFTVTSVVGFWPAGMR